MLSTKEKIDLISKDHKTLVDVIHIIEANDFCLSTCQLSDVNILSCEIENLLVGENKITYAKHDELIAATSKALVEAWGSGIARGWMIRNEQV